VIASLATASCLAQSELVYNVLHYTCSNLAIRLKPFVSDSTAVYASKFWVTRTAVNQRTEIMSLLETQDAGASICDNFHIIS